MSKGRNSLLRHDKDLLGKSWLDMLYGRWTMKMTLSGHYNHRRLLNHDHIAERLFVI